MLHFLQCVQTTNVAYSSFLQTHTGGEKKKQAKLAVANSGTIETPRPLSRYSKRQMEVKN